MNNYLKRDLDDRGVLTLALNRPEKSNAFDDQLIEALLVELKDAAETPGVKLIQLKGEGRHFCAGADLAWMQRMVDYDFADNVTDARKLAELMDTLYRLPQPTLALVQGAAYGGGVGLASCCDMVIASDQARFCLSEVRIGLIPAVISPYVIRAMGERQARRYFLSAEVMSAAQAQVLGLVHEVVPEADLAATANQWADTVLANNHAAVLAAKDLILSVSQHAIDDELLDDVSDRIAYIRVSKEGQTGLRTSLER